MTRKSPSRLKRALSPTAFARLVLSGFQLDAHMRRLQRQENREMMRVIRHSRYAAGGSTQHERERLRRIGQIVAGRLTVSNGLVIE